MGLKTKIDSLMTNTQFYQRTERFIDKSSISDLRWLCIAFAAGLIITPLMLILLYVLFFVWPEPISMQPTYYAMPVVGAFFWVVGWYQVLLLFGVASQRLKSLDGPSAPKT